jgi:hypothetical protein
MLRSFPSTRSLDFFCSARLVAALYPRPAPTVITARRALFLCITPAHETPHLGFEPDTKQKEAADVLKRHRAQIVIEMITDSPPKRIMGLKVPVACTRSSTTAIG